MYIVKENKLSPNVFITTEIKIKGSVILSPMLFLATTKERKNYKLIYDQGTIH